MDSELFLLGAHNVPKVLPIIYHQGFSFITEKWFQGLWAPGECMKENMFFGLGDEQECFVMEKSMCIIVRVTAMKSKNRAMLGDIEWQEATRHRT